MNLPDSARRLGRREFISFGVGAFAVASLPIAAGRRLARGAVVRRTMPVMGTLAEFAVVHRDPAVAHAAIDAAMAELTRVERTMTRFTTTSFIGRANLEAASAPVPVDAPTALVVAEALRWAAATGGAFDPAVGGIVRRWDVTHRHEPPPADALAPLAGRHLHRAVEVGAHRGAHVLRYHDRDVSLDLGAIAKGYGVDRAVDALRRHGIRQAVVDVGGDLYALGESNDGEPWRIGIQHPADARALVGTIEVRDAAIATSGTYLQYFRWRGARYHHLMDPATAAPRETRTRSLTIRADSCMHADVAATALYGMSVDEGNALLRRVAPGASIVSTL